MKQLSLLVKGMCCVNCNTNVKNIISNVPGVKHASIDFSNETVLIHYDPKTVNPEKIKEIIERSGYGVEQFVEKMQECPVMRPS